MKVFKFLLAAQLVTFCVISSATVPAVTELDSYLQTQESRFTDITPHTEKIIHWHGPVGEATEHAIVYIHGFSATRQEIMPLPQMVAETLAANIFYTRLSGHGRPGQHMGEADSSDWIRDAREAWEIGQRLGRKVILISVSTGGTLSTWISAQPSSKQLHSQILISPNFDIADKSGYLLTWPYGLEVAQWFLDNERGFSPHNPEQAKYWTTRYPLTAVKQLLNLLQEVEKLDKTTIKAPTQIIYSPEDKVVDTAAIEEAYMQLGSPIKQLIPYTGSTDPSQHCLAGDILSPNSNAPLHEMIVNFIRNRR